MLIINNLYVNAKNNCIIKNLSLNIYKGKIHLIMGPNGSGKTTLVLSILGHKDYKIINGDIFFENKNITNISTYEKSLMGIFSTFQNPIEIPGINNFDFLYHSLNSVRKSRNLKKISIEKFNKIINKYINELKIDNSFLYRHVNVCYSGGEKKKNEILQMKIIKPKLIIFDEIDSGLDIDSLKIIFKSIKKFNNKNKSIIIITHRENILNYIKPNFVHIMINGNIIKTGNIELLKEVNKFGYEHIK